MSDELKDGPLARRARAEAQEFTRYAEAVDAYHERVGVGRYAMTKDEREAWEMMRMIRVPSPITLDIWALTERVAMLAKWPDEGAQTLRQLIMHLHKEGDQLGEHLALRSLTELTNAGQWLTYEDVVSQWEDAKPKAER